NRSWLRSPARAVSPRHSERHDGGGDSPCRDPSARLVSCRVAAPVVAIRRGPDRQQGCPRERCSRKRNGGPLGPPSQLAPDVPAGHAWVQKSTPWCSDVGRMCVTSAITTGAVPLCASTTRLVPVPLESATSESHLSATASVPV